MHRAKAFFFACLGILCLVAAYQLGASSAKAQTQSQGFAACGDAGPFGTWVATAEGTAWFWSGGGWYTMPSIPIAAGDVVVGGCGALAITASGTLYRVQDPGVWVSLGAPQGVVSAQTMSVGQLKTKYATPRPTE